MSNTERRKIILVKTKKEITDLLLKYNFYFTPPIETKVGNISTYSEKILEKAYIYSIYEDNKNIGFIIFYANDNKTKIAYISFIAIDESFQNKQVGSELLLFCYKECISLGMKFLKLEVRKDNKNAITFYEKNNFFYSCDASDNSIYMTKEL